MKTNRYNICMDAFVAQKLIQLNLQFYQTFAEPFSATRQRLQPGVRRVVQGIPADHRVLELGCGNGRLWLALLEQGHQGDYVGIDNNAIFLQEARQIAVQHANLGENAPKPLFLLADLTVEDWEKQIPLSQFDHVIAFALLHHLPSQERRKHFLKQIQFLLHPNGHFVFSVWQFLNSPSLRARIQDWSLVGLSPEQVDPGDYLLDWRSGGLGLRYVHHFSASDLCELADTCGFEIRNSFLSDGKGGNLSLYQDWVAIQKR